MIVHKNVPSNENMLQFNSSKPTEEEEGEEAYSDRKVYKRPKSNHAILNEPNCQTESFRRVESTSSFKRLPKLSTEEGESENAEPSAEKFSIQINSMNSSNFNNERDLNEIYNQKYQQCEIQLIESHDQEETHR